jgi:hypothetical protein
MTGDRQTSGELHPGEADGQDGGQPVTGFRTKKAAFLARYRRHSEYGNRSAAGRVVAELAPLAGLQAGTGPTCHRDPVEDDDDQPAG